MEKEKYKNIENFPRESKAYIWEKTCREIQEKIKRELKEYEALTIAYIIESRFFWLELEKDMLGQLFEIKPEDKAMDILLKIHQRLHSSLESSYREIYIADTCGEIYASTNAILYRQSLYDKLTDTSSLLFNFAQKAHLIQEQDMLIPNIPTFLVPVWAVRYYH